MLDREPTWAWRRVEGSAPPRALSIVEVLVSISILGVLIGLLVPALSSVGEAARSTECRSNLRQMHIAAQAYINVYDAFPAALRFENDGVFTTVAWDFTQTASGDITPGALWQGMTVAGQVHQCPSFHGDSTFAADPFTGYNYNTTYLGGEAPFPLVGWEHVRRGVAPHACRRASQCAMFGEGAWALGANKFMRAPMNSVESNLELVYGGGQAFRHGGATNVIYIDGHVGSSDRPHRGELATPHLLDDVMAYPENGFLSNDDSSYDPR